MTSLPYQEFFDSKTSGPSLQGTCDNYTGYSQVILKNEMLRLLTPKE